MAFIVPTNKQLEQNISEKVIDNFAEIVFVAESGSYEMRSVLKLLDKFDSINKCSYGALMDFSYHCSNVSRYYKNKEAKILLKQIIADIDRFLASYADFLI